MKYGAKTYSISIHALRVEGDVSHLIGYNGAITISIHALRVEGDRLFLSIL